MKHVANKVTALLLTLMLIINLVPAAAFAVTSNDVTFDDDGEFSDSIGGNEGSPDGDGSGSNLSLPEDDDPDPLPGGEETPSDGSDDDDDLDGAHGAATAGEVEGGDAPPIGAIALEVSPARLSLKDNAPQDAVIAVTAMRDGEDASADVTFGVTVAADDADLAKALTDFGLNVVGNELKIPKLPRGVHGTAKIAITAHDSARDEVATKEVEVAVAHNALVVVADPGSVSRSDDEGPTDVSLSCRYGSDGLSDEDVAELEYEVISVEGDPALVDALGSLAITGGVLTIPAIDADVLKGDASATITLEARRGGDAAQTQVALGVAHINKAPSIALSDTSLSFVENHLDVQGVGFSVKDHEDDASALNVSCSGYDAGLISAIIKDGKLLVTPHRDAHGTTTIAVTVTDAKGATDSASVFVRVSENGAPVMPATYFGDTKENATLVIDDLTKALNATDPEGDAISYSLTQASTAQGVARIEGNTLSYAPVYPKPRSATTTDSFTVIASDGHGKTAACAFTITIENVNDAPVSSGDQGVATDEDVARVIELDGIASDDDLDDALSYHFENGELMLGTGHGSASIDPDAKVLTYQPDLDFNGEDGFAVIVSDGNGGSCSVNFGVAVAPVNDAPFILSEDAQPLTGSVNENISDALENSYVLDVSALFGDVDLQDVPLVDALTFMAVPVNIRQAGDPKFQGAFQLVDGVLSFTPAIGYNDSWTGEPVRFTLIARDLAGAEAELLLEIGVTSVDSPVALEDDTIGAVEKRVTKTFNAAELLANDHCYDCFDEPAFALVIDRLDEDSENDGTIAYDALTGEISYTSAPKYDGPDSFHYYVVGRDGAVYSAAVSVTVSPKNYPPDITIDSPEPFTMQEDATEPLVILFHVDDDSTPVDAVQVLRLLNPPSSLLKSVALEPGAEAGHYKLSILPKQDATGTDSVRIQASDLVSEIVTNATVTVSITPVNDAPIAVGFGVSAVEDQGDIVITLRAAGHFSDVDNEFGDMTFNFDAEAVLAANQGVLEACAYDSASGIVTIRFVKDYNTVDNGHGAFSMPFTVNDNSTVEPTNLQSAAGYISVNVSPVNDAPVIDSFEPSLLTFDEDGSGTATIAFSDVETPNSQLIFSARSNHPEIINADCIRFETMDGVTVIRVSALKDANWDEAEHPDDPLVITFTASDGYLTASSELKVYVTSVNDAPEAHDDHYGVEDGSALDIFPLGNDTDPDKGDALRIELDSQPTLGTLTEIIGADGLLIGYTFTAYEGEAGTETITYRAIDRAGEASQATITIDVVRREPWPNISQVDPMIVEMSRGETNATGTQSVFLNGIPRGASYTLTATLAPSENGDAFVGISLGGEASGARTVTISGVNGTNGTSIELPLGIEFAHNWVGKAVVWLDLSCTYQDGGREVTKQDDTSFRVVVWAQNTPPHADDINLELGMPDGNGGSGSASATIYGENPNNGGKPYVYDDENPVSLALQGLTAPNGGFQFGWAEADVDTGIITYFALDTLPGTQDYKETFEYNIVDKGGKEADGEAETAKGKVHVTIKHVDRPPVAVADMFLLPDNWTAGASYTFEGLLQNDYDLDNDSEFGAHRVLTPGTQIKIIKVTDDDGHEITGAQINADGTITLPIGDPIREDAIQTFHYYIETWDETDGSGKWVPALKPGRIDVGFSDVINDPIGGDVVAEPLASKPMVQDYEITIYEDANGNMPFRVDLGSLVMAQPMTGYLDSAIVTQGEGLIGFSLPPDAAGDGTDEEAYTEQNYYLDISAEPDRHGTAVIKFRVRSGYRPSNSKVSEAATLTVHIRPVNDRPVFDEADHRYVEADMAQLETKQAPYVFQSEPVTITRGEVASFAVQAFDVDSKNLKVSAMSLDESVVDSLTISVEPSEGGWVINVPTIVRKPNQYVVLPDEVVILASVTDGALTSYGAFTVKFDPQPAPALLPSEPQDIAEDTNARFTVIKDGEAGNNPNNDKFKVVIEEVTLDGQPLAQGGKVVALDGIGTVSVPDGKSVLFTPAKDYFQLDDDPYIVIRYHLEDEIDLRRAPSETGELRVRVFAQNDKVEIRNFNQKFITALEDAAQRLVIEYDVKDVDRGYERTGDGSTIEKAVVIGVTHEEADKQLAPAPISGIEQEVTGGPDLYHVALTFAQAENAFHPDINKVTGVRITADHCGAGSAFSDARDFLVYVSPSNDAPHYAADASIQSGSLVLAQACKEDDPGFVIKLRSFFDDIDDDQKDLSITALSPDTSSGRGGHGSITNNGDGTVTYKPARDFCTYDEQNDSLYAWFDFTISDPHNGTYSGKLKIYVEPVNDAPVASSYGVSMLEDGGSVAITNPLAHVSDVDTHVDFVYTGALGSAKPYPDSVVKLAPIDLSVVTEDMGSIAFNDTTGGYTFSPAKDYYGTIRIPFSALDSEGVSSNVAYITINVEPVNDMPRMAFMTDDGEWVELDAEPGQAVSLGSALRRNENSTLGDERGADSPHETWTVRFKLWDIDSPQPMNNMVISADANGLIPKIKGHSVAGKHGKDEGYTLTLHPNANKNGSVVLTFKAWDEAGSEKAATYHATISTLPFNTQPWFATPAMDGGVVSHTLKENEDAGTVNLSSLTAADREDKTGFRFTLVDGDGYEVSSIVTELGVLSLDEGGQYRFARGGEYTNRFGTRSFTARVYDTGDPANDPAANDDAQPKFDDCTIRVVVEPENDMATPPGNLTVEPNAYNGELWFRKGDVVSVSWTASADWPKDAGEETPQDLLRYDFSYRVGTLWTHITIDKSTPGASYGSDGTIRYSFNAPAGNADDFLVRVWAVDNGELGKDVDGNGGYAPDYPMHSNNALSTYMKLDNTLPSISSAASPTVNTNLVDPTCVTIAYTISDSDTDPGATGVDLSTLEFTDVTPGRAAALEPLTLVHIEGNKYAVQLTNNGTYRLTVKDFVGNTQVRDVVVGNIDRLPPDAATFVPNGGTFLARSSIQVKLSADDAPENEAKTDKQSGVASIHWMLSGSAGLSPAVNDPAWSTYASSVDLSGVAKGSYYLYAKVTDKAGNVTINRSNEFVLKNNPPTFTGSSGSAINEDYGATYAVDIPVKDIDDDDLKLETAWTAPAGSAISGLQISGYDKAAKKFTITFDLIPDAFDAKGIAIPLTMSDDEENAAPFGYTLIIRPVNDPPAAPSAPKMDKAMYKGGGQVEVSWTKPVADADKHWTTETPNQNLSYEVQHTVDDGATWSRAAPFRSAPDDDSLNFAAPNRNSDHFRVRVRTLDDGSFGNESGQSGALSSNWIQSADTKLDSTKPSLTSDAPTGWFNQATAPNGVSFTLAAADLGTAGKTGLASVEQLDGLPGLGVSSANITGAGTPNAAFSQALTGAQNGTYTFAAQDQVGNETLLNVPVLLDRNPPSAASFELLTGDPLYAHGTAQVKITAGDDADATQTDAKSGLARLDYQITGSAATPADGDWTPVGTAPGANTTVNVADGRAKGTYYVHARATDVAGNATDASFAVVLVNNPPAFEAVPNATETIEEDGSYTFGVSASDIDGASAENLQLSASWDEADKAVVPDAGVSIEKQGDGAFALTITPAADAFSRAGVAFTLTLTDADGGTAIYPFTLAIHPINDEPDASEIGGAANETVTDAYRQFKGGDSVRASFGQADDFHWTQETLVGALMYELQYSLDGQSDWRTVGDAAFDADGFVFSAPGNADSEIINSDDFSLRVITRDDGSMDNGDDPGEPLSATSAVFGPMQLDNHIPVVNSGIDPVESVWTNRSVTINLDVTDEGVGQTGVRELTSVDSTVTGSDGSYQAVVTDNGSYGFTAYDMVLNAAPHSVTVLNIDKLAPLDAMFSPNGIEQLAYQQLEVSLDFADAEETLTDGHSGIEFRRYLITTDPGLTPGENSGWTDYSAPIDMSGLGKGTYYIWAMATDAAGNITYTRSNPFALRNNAPSFAEGAPTGLTVMEDNSALTPDGKYMGGTRELSVTIPVEDVDGDMLTLTPSWNGGLNIIPANGIEVSGYAANPGGRSGSFTMTIALTEDAFSAPGGIEVALTLSDGSDVNAENENEFIYTLIVDPVNDAPDPIAIDAVTNESYAAIDMFKADDAVLVRFGQSDDFRWAQETLRGDIDYQLQYRLNDGDWTDVTQQGYDADGFTFAAPGAIDTDTFYVRVRAIDDGNTFEGGRPDAVMGQLASDWAMYGPMQIDVTAPVASLDYQPKAWTNGDVTLTVTTHDEEPLTNDRTAVDIVRCEDVTPGRAEADREACALAPTGADGEYSVVVGKNGTYEFTVIDSVGNVTTLRQTIDTIDKRAPFSGAQPANNTSILNGNGGILVQLSLFDEDADDFYGQSGLAGGWYLIDNSAAAPSSDSDRWLAANEPFGSAQQQLNARGTYYAHTKLVDAAGTETIQTFGPYAILNNAPVLTAPSDLYTVQNQSVSGTSSASDADGDALSIRVSSGNEGVIPSGNVQASVSGSVLSVTVTPALNAYSVGGVPVTITADDGNGGTATATFRVFVYHINGAPAATVSGSGATTQRGKALAGQITVSAQDGADGEFANRTFSFSIAQGDQGRNGRFSVDAQGNVSYTPRGDFVGTDSAMISVSETQSFLGNVNPAVVPSGAFVAGTDQLGVKVGVSVNVTAPDPTATPRPTTPAPSPTPAPDATNGPRPTLPVVTPNPNPTVDPLTQYDPDATPDPNALTEIPFGDPDGGNGGSIPIHRLRPFSYLNGLNFEELGIPLGALPSFASAAGYTLDQIDELLGELNDGEPTRLYSDEYLAKIFDMPYQMVKPIDFDEIDWETMPERGYEIPIIARGMSVVAHAWFRPVLNEELEEGYLFEIEFEPGVLGDPNFAGIHFATRLRDIMMSETQYMDPELFEREDEWRMNQFIPKDFMTGKQFLFIAVPVVFDPEGHEAFEPTEEQLNDWHDRTEELQLAAPHIPPYDPEQDGPRLAYDPEHHGWYSETQREAPEGEDAFGQGIADDDEMIIVDDDDDEEEMETIDEDQIGAPRS